MGDKKENLKSLFTNTRSRLIIIFTAAVLIVAILVGVLKMQKHILGGPDGSDTGQSPQGIQSIPGGLNPTQQYSKLQNKQNIDQAKAALSRGQSAIPTIIKSQQFGKGVNVVGSKDGEGSVGFSTLAREHDNGGAKSLWEQELKNGSCAAGVISKVIQEGAPLTTVKEACSCQELKVAGLKLNDLKQVCSCKALRESGYNAMQLKNAGYNARQLRVCGFDACALKNAGFTAQELSNAGFSDGELKGAGFNVNSRKLASGIPPGMTAADILKAGCSPDALRKLRERGVSAKAIRQISGCSPSQLKAAGYTAKELHDAGFTAAELKRAGFSPSELRKAGYSAHQLLNAGFSPDDLKDAGFSTADIDKALDELPAGITPADVKKAGCSAKALAQERRAGISAAAIRKYAHCSAEQLAKAGFSNSQLKYAGFSPDDIKKAREKLGEDYTLPAGVTEQDVKQAGCDPAKLKVLREKGVSAAAIRSINHCSAKALKDAGFSASALKQAGFSNKELADAGYTPEEIAKAGLGLPEGITKEDVQKAGCDPAKLKELREKGVSAAAIKRLNGCSDRTLKEAGFSPAQIAKADLGLPAGISAQDVQRAGCDPAKLRELREKGVSAAAIKKLNGCSDSALKQAGFTPAQIAGADLGLPAGVTAEDVQRAGCDPAKLRALRNRGVSAAAIRKLNGCSYRTLRDAGFSPEQIADVKTAAAAAALANLRKEGCTLEALKHARRLGVSALSIRKTMGCSAKQLRAAGYTLEDLKDAGFTPGELAKAGFTPKEMLAAGFSPEELAKDGLLKSDDGLPPGVTAQMVKDAGCDPEALRKLREKGVSASTIVKMNGCSAKALKAAGYTDAEIAKALGATLPPGVSVSDVKSAGCELQKLKALKAQGVSANAIRKLNGCSAASLLAAGFTPDELKKAGFNDVEIKAGQNEMASKLAGIGDASEKQDVLQGIENAAGDGTQVKSQAAQNAEKLNQLFEKQRQRYSDQKFKLKIDQAAALMTGAAQSAVGDWKKAPSQSYTYIGPQKTDEAANKAAQKAAEEAAAASEKNKPALVKAGKVIFAVLDTSINSDEPGPVLATVVSGRFRGAKLIGAFTRPSDGEKVVLSFNMMSVKGAPKTTSIAAVAIDPNTARTALSSRTDNHYLLRYGSLFASSSLEGFGNAFQSAGTTITVGGTSASDITVQQGIGRSILENAVIGLADVGKRWGQQAQRIFDKPPTVYVYSGTGLGILFTRDLTSL